MKVFTILIFLFLTKLSFSYYSGTLIDAHSQVRCDTKPNQVIKLIKNSDVDYVLLSAGGCYKKEKYFSKKHSQRLINSIKGKSKIFLLNGLKPINGKKQSVNKKKNIFKKILNYGQSNNAVGSAEILIQHAVWDDPRLKTSGVDLSLSDELVRFYVNNLVKNNHPVILHIEAKDAEHKSEQTLLDLEELLALHQNHPFILIHMGQLSPTQVGHLISNHKNIFFLTSMSDGQFQIVAKMKSMNTQNGWISVFDTSSNNHKEHINSLSWKNEWRELFDKHSSRFILAFDNVFIGNWKKRNPRSIKIWRKALSQLNSNSAKNIACFNANKMWNLGVNCK